MKASARLLAAAVVVAAALIWLVAGWFSPALRVEAVPARIGRIVESVDERAVTRLPETYVLSTPAAGRIEAIPLVEGTPVKAGQVVAQFVPIDLDLAVREAEAAAERLQAAIRQSGDTTVEETGLKQARKYVDSTAATVSASKERIRAGKEQWNYATKERKRVERLISKGARTEDDLDRAKLQEVQGEVDYWQDFFIHAAMLSLQAATDLMPEMVQQYIDRKGLGKAVQEKQLTEALVRLDQARLNQKRGTMTSPVDGVVLRRFVRDEGYLAGGTKLLEIGSLERMEVEADVLSVDVVNVKPKDPVEIYGPAIGSPSARGIVDRIYPAGFTKVSSLGVEQQRVTVVIRFDPKDLARLLAERGLGVGYRVRVRIQTATKPDALVVPRSALFRGPGGGWQLYVLRDGRARIRDVALGILNDELAEVTEGLSEGDLVVPSPESNLAEGQRVLAVVREARGAANPAILPSQRGNGD
jgi:HlyD family secretion protein